jgi:uncharacterized repeat protein (TIGR01451 family)
LVGANPVIGTELANQSEMFSVAANFGQRACLSLAAVVLLAAFEPSLRADAPDLKANLLAQLVVTDGGKETFLPAEKAKPGDVIQYQAVYRNSGNAAARNVAVTLPIPTGLALVAESASPAAEQATRDGTKFAAVPLTQKVKNAAGVEEEQPVPLSDYRALRWTISELPAGGTTTVSLRARVLTNTVAH